jgi:hypothetical protein
MSAISQSIPYLKGPLPSGHPGSSRDGPSTNLETLTPECIGNLSVLIMRASKDWEVLTQLQDALSAITIKNLEFNDSIKLLVSLTQSCYTSSSPRVILEVVLKSWCACDDDVDAIIGDLASMIYCPDNVLKYVCQTLSLTSTVFGILELVIENRKGSNIGFTITADRLIMAFQDSPMDLFSDQEVWDALLQVAIRTGKPTNGDVIQYIRTKLGQASQPAPRPSWVSVITGETLQLLNTISSGPPPSSEMVSRIIEKVNSQIVATSQPRSSNPDENESDPTSSIVPQRLGSPSDVPANLNEMIQMYIATAIPEELELLDQLNTDNSVDFDNQKDHFTDQVEKSLCKEGVYREGYGGLFPREAGAPERLWGPVNAIINRQCSVSQGPCRMLSCVCRDLDQECDEDLNPASNLDSEQWFTGRCDQCQRSLLNISYAIRFPVTDGGWVGCFCSWHCLKARPPRPIFAEEMAAINRVKAVIEQFGILDRASAPP